MEEHRKKTLSSLTSEEQPCNEWELCKENVQPLRQGRKMESLNSGLQSAHNDEGHRRLALKKIEFENALRVYSGNDPLEPWISYIDWTEQHFPKGGKEGSLCPLIEKCIAEFRDDDKYKNDERYVNICLKLANMSIDPLEVFGFMYALKTGITVASFYVKWAHALETAGNLKKADAIFLRGLKNKAHPPQLLELRHKEFLSRLVNRSAENSSSDTHHQQLEEQRIAMGSLKSFGHKHVVGTARTGDAIAAVNNQEIEYSRPNVHRKSSGRVMVRVDEKDTENDIIPDCPNVMPKSSMMSTVGQASAKENEPRPGKWTGVKFSQKTGAVPPIEFDVHRDESLAATQATQQVIRPGVSVLSETKVVKSDSLQAFRCSKPASTPHFLNKPNELSMYRRDLVYGGVEEFQFEEVRAAIYMKRRAEEEKDKLMKEQAERIKQMEQEILKVTNQRPAIYMKRRAEEEKDKLMKEQAERIKQMEQEILKMTNQRAGILKLVKSLLQTKGLPPNPDFVKQIMIEMGHQATEQDILDVTILCEAEQLNPLEEASQKQDLKESSVSITPMMTPAFKPPPIGNRSVVAATPTINMKEAMNIAIEIFNRPNSICEPAAIKDDLSERKASQRLAFDVYVDPHGDSDSANKTLTSSGCRQEEKVEDYSSLEKNPKSIPQGPPFKVYVDPLETASQLDHESREKMVSSPFQPLKVNSDEYAPKRSFKVFIDKESHDEVFDNESHSEFSENEQNIPPCDYVQNESKRPLTGILTPSANVTFLPLKDPRDDASDEDVTPDQQDEEEEGEYSEEINKEVGRDDDDVDVGLSSFTMPANTLYFTNNAKLVSTPVGTSSSSTNNPSTESTSSVSDAGGLAEEIRARAMSLQQIQAACQRRSLVTGPGETKFLDLSLIIETSRDYKSSSSGSSGASGASSAAASHFRSTFSKTKTLVDHSSVIEKRNQSRGVVASTQNKSDSHLNASNDAVALATFSYADPFNEELIGKFLEELQVPVENRSGVKVMRGQMPNFSANMLITVLGDSYFIEHKIGRGAYASIFKVNCNVDSGDNESCLSENMIFKVQTPACPWEFYIADELQHRLKKLDFRVDITSSVMQIPFMYLFNNGSVFATDFHKCTLLHLVNQYSKKSQTMPEPLAIYFTIEILHIVEQFHACQIIHADLKPDNFMLLDVPPIQIYNSATPFGDRTSMLKLIDYGRCIDMSLFPSGTQFTGRVNTECFDCIEMKEGRPWTYQTDLYGVAGCAHVMLFGKYMEPEKSRNGKWLITEKIRRYWQADVWYQFFETLLNGRDGDRLRDIAALRHSLEQCLVSSKKRTLEFNARMKELSSIYGQIRL